MNDNGIVRSIRVGTVDFFGIMIPGVLLITFCAIGFFIPLVLLILDFSEVTIAPIEIGAYDVLVTLFLLLVFSYLFGYILRLSSPDQLDRKSAIKVIRGEYFKSLYKEIPTTFSGRIFRPGITIHTLGKWIYSSLFSWDEVRKWIEKDGWPFDPSDPSDKYPYLNFRRYLEKRGHRELAEEVVVWGRNLSNAKRSSRPNNPVQRSKSEINRMKLSIRYYCPDLYALVEAKEAHIRLMAGTWAALKFSQWPLWMVLIFFSVAKFMPQWINSLQYAQFSGDKYLVYIFTNLTLLLVVFFCNRRIEKLFHYRRVNELFHIVQAAYFVEEQNKHKKKGKSHAELRP